MLNNKAAGETAATVSKKVRTRSGFTKAMLELNEAWNATAIQTEEDGKRTKTWFIPRDTRIRRKVYVKNRRPIKLGVSAASG